MSRCTGWKRRPESATTPPANKPGRQDRTAGSPVVIRYADDVIALCHSQEQAHNVKERMAEWLAPKGLVFNQDKTTIVHLDQGFDHLGFNVRRYRGRQVAHQTQQGRHRADT